MPERANPILMKELLDHTETFEQTVERRGHINEDGLLYELIEVVGSKQMKVNGDWQELGYYLTYKRVYNY